MLFQKTQKTPWALFFFGIIAIGIVAACAGVVFLFIHKKSFTPGTSYFSTLPTSPEAVAAQYKKDVAALQSRLATLADNQVEAEAEASMLTIRVPATLLDSHLSALLDIKKSIGKQDEAMIVRRIVEALSKKAGNV